jgi:glycosyltransferase involved in cell wall biosynthesis
LSKSLHILFLSSWYPNKYEPTNGNFVEVHAQAVATKHQVTCVHVKLSFDVKTTIREERINGEVKNIIIYLPKSKNPLRNFFKKLRVYKKETEKINFDLIHANVLFPIAPIAYLLKRKYKKPLVCTEHWTIFQQKESPKYIEWFYKLFAGKMDMLLPVSQSLKNILKSKNISGNYHVVGNVVSPDLFFPKKNNPDLFTITHISTFRDDHKNISGILRTAKRLSETNKNIVLQIIGDGDLNKLNELIESIGIEKRYLQVEGTKTPKEIAEILQNSDVYLSFSNYETFGIVMIESLLCGTPVISTNTGILPELEPDTSFQIIDIGDEEELLRRIISYQENPIRTSEEYRNYLISKFSQKNIAHQFDELYQKLVKSY